jgi:hypothetical protein
MRPKNLFRFVIILLTIIAVCGLQLHAQSLNPRTPLGAAARAAARRLAGRAAGSPAAAPIVQLSETPGTFITFDAPGAAPGPFQGTVAVSINPAGEILGYSFLSNGFMAAFLRNIDGTFNTFNVPGALLYAAAFSGEGPAGSSLNPAAEATGGYVDPNFVVHGFVRDPEGAITTFDAPGAGTIVGSFQGTTPLAINPAGEVTGYYFDTNFFVHGFFRDLHGAVTDFDAPGASAACFFGLTFPSGINAAGDITGNYSDSECNPHGFLRERNGAVTVVDVPNFIGTVPEVINDAGEIAGFGIDQTGADHGFVRDNRGAFTLFDISGLEDMDINPAGVIAGTYIDGNFVWHGFRRTADGTLTTIDVPGAGTGPFQGTKPESINPAGVITGSYLDTNGFSHGFLFLPQ